MSDRETNRDFLSLDPSIEILLPEAPVDLKTVPVVTTAPRLAARQVAEQMGETSDPLRFLLETVKDESKPMVARLDAAKAAAPFLYPKLAAVAVADASQKTIEDILAGLPDSY